VIRLGLKVDVATSRGARIGVPRLMELFSRHNAGASFFFALGPERLLHRSWLPGAELGRRRAALLRNVRDAGFEVGIQAFDPVRWMSRSVEAGQAWTREQMEHACASFMRVFGVPPHAHAASGWRMNRHAWRLTQRLGFRYSSDTRGSCPYIPVCNAEVVACPQLPTTLPTLEELIARDRIRDEEAVGAMLRATANPPLTGHVFSMRAEREGLRYAPLLDELLAAWRAQGYTFTPLQDFLLDINLARLPRHAVAEGTVPGRTPPVALQANEFLC
jgi:peptidoglycan/xylan/chitin deacetylase (PgdA/CDA1 family)